MIQIRKRFWPLLISASALLLIGVILAEIQPIVNSTTLTAPLSYTGILLIYLSLALLYVSMVISCKAEHFLGSYSYFTPEISKLTKETSSTRRSGLDGDWENESDYGSEKLRYMTCFIFIRKRATVLKSNLNFNGKTVNTNMLDHAITENTMRTEIQIGDIAISL